MDSDTDAVARHHSGTAILALILGAAAVLVVAFFTFWLPLIIGTVVMTGTTWPY